MKATPGDEHGAGSVQWNPLNKLHNVRDQVGSAFESALIDEDSKSSRFDVVECQEEHVIKAELPGFNQEEVSVFLDGGILTIAESRNYRVPKRVRAVVGFEKNGKQYLAVLPSQSR